MNSFGWNKATRGVLLRTRSAALAEKQETLLTRGSQRPSGQRRKTGGAATVCRKADHCDKRLVMGSTVCCSLESRGQTGTFDLETLGESFEKPKRRVVRTRKSLHP